MKNIIFLCFLLSGCTIERLDPEVTETGRIKVVDYSYCDGEHFYILTIDSVDYLT